MNSRPGRPSSSQALVEKRVRNPLIIIHTALLVVVLATLAITVWGLGRSVDLSGLRVLWVVGPLSALAFLVAAAATVITLRELGRHARETRLATELARQAATSRRELVAASDELRTPLRLISEHATSLEQLHARGPTERDALAAIKRATTTVDRQLEALFDVSRLQDGSVSLHAEVCRVEHLLERAVEACRARADAKAIRVRSDATQGQVHADADRIGQVLLVLIDIALERSRAGADVVVSAAPLDDAVRFAVTESGSGSLPEALSRLFGTRTTEPTQNNKLDLYVCKRLIEAHGGTMGFESCPPGMTSWFVVPTEPRLLR